MARPSSARFRRTSIPAEGERIDWDVARFALVHLVAIAGPTLSSILIRS